MKPLEVVSTCLLCSALLGCSGGSDSLLGGAILADGFPADGVPVVGDEGSTDTTAVAGLWLNMIDRDEGDPPGYLEILDDGEYINWESSETENCLFRLGPFPIRNLGSDEYAIPEQTSTMVNQGDRLSLTDFGIMFELPAVTNFTSADFNVCEGLPDFSPVGWQSSMRR